MHFFFVKPDLRQTSSSHYSGGQHGFLCAAQALAASGHSVHLLYTSPKAELMFSLMQHGCLGSLSYSKAVEGVAVWSLHGISHHVSLSDVQASTQHELSTAMAALCDSHQGPTVSAAHQRLVDECSCLIKAHQQQGQQQQDSRAWVVLDADGSQQALPGSNSSFLEACCAALPPSMLLLLVQNIHFLPLGPQGTAPRSPGLLQSWSQLGGVLCVSDFVARYVSQHATHLGLSPNRIYCVHYAAFGAFGSGPFPDYGTAAAQHLPWPPEACSNSTSNTSTTSTTNSSSSSVGLHHAPGTNHSSWRPTVGCLKLSPEKGGLLFLSLAKALPELQFLAVCADSDLQAPAAQLPNVKLVLPGDVNALLQHMTVVLAPSLWQEAYGMVVTEALLRGIPVIVSNQGGLTEASLGCPAAVVPVQPMQLPAAAGVAAPSWQSRVLPQDQDLAGWAQALRRLLGSPGVYEACSRAGREAAVRLVQHQGQLLGQLVEWLKQQS